MRYLSGFRIALCSTLALGWMGTTLLAQGAGAPAAAGQKPLDGAALFQAKACATCHGADGNHPIAPNYPKLAGQNAAYLQAQFTDIMSGKRNNGLTAVMKATLNAVKVSDQEAKAIAEWLGKQS